MAHIIVGSYEDFVVGYKFEDGKRPLLDQTFAIRAHSGSVKCVSASPDGLYAISCGNDEMINYLGIKKRKLIQTVEGAVNCATFFGSSHLICGSQDSNIYIYECKGSGFTQVKTLKGHKSPVTSISLHHSGKVLLSLSNDNTMRTWNLIKGRCAYVTNINVKAQLIAWSATGEEFVIAAENEIYLFNGSGNLEHHIKLNKRVNAVEFVGDQVFVVATDSAKLEWFDLKTCTSLMTYEAHETRIKSVRYLGNRSGSGGSRAGGEGCAKGSHLIATMSSDGIVKVWATANPGKEKPQELASESTGARLTCMTSAISS